MLSKRKYPIGSLIVLAVLLIGATYLFAPALVRARRSARAAECMSNLRQIGLGCHMYAMDHGGRLPDDLVQLYPRYASLQCFFCPGHYNGRPPKRIETLDEASVSYKLIHGVALSDDPDTIFACEKCIWNHGGVWTNAVHVDGHVSLIRADGRVKVDFDQIARGLSLFFADNGRYPANEEGLEALVTSGCLKNVPVDPFDRDGRRPYGYATNNVRNNWILTCYGPDNDRDIDLSLYSKGKLSTEDLLRLRARLVALGMILKDDSGDMFRVDP